MAALPAIRSRSVSPTKQRPWKSSDNAKVATSRREQRASELPSPMQPRPASLSPLGKPDLLQWQRSMGVRRGGKDQVSDRSIRKKLIDNGSRMDYQQPRRRKKQPAVELLGASDSNGDMHVALHRNKVVRKSEGRTPKVSYSKHTQRSMGRSTHAAAASGRGRGNTTTASRHGMMYDEEALPSLGDESDVRFPTASRLLSHCCSSGVRLLFDCLQLSSLFVTQRPGMFDDHDDSQSAYLAAVRDINNVEPLPVVDEADVKVLHFILTNHDFC